MAKWTDRKRGGSEIDLDVFLEPGILSGLQEVLRTGALCSFGLSRDGGSLSCTVTFEGDWDRCWFREPAELTAWMQACAADIMEDTGGEVRRTPPPTAQVARKRPRGRAAAAERR